MTSLVEMKKVFGPQLTTWDDAEEDRFEYIEEYERNEPIPQISKLTYMKVEATWKERSKEEAISPSA